MVQTPEKNLVFLKKTRYSPWVKGARDCETSQVHTWHTGKSNRPHAMQYYCFIEAKGVWTKRLQLKWRKLLRRRWV